MITIKVGTRVKVGPRYVGSGRYAPDEFTGSGWFVVGVVPPGSYGGTLDYKLAKHPEDPWEVMIHHSRVTVE